MTDTPLKKRPWFQLHLSTCVVLMFVAAGLLFMQMNPLPEGCGSPMHPQPIYGFPAAIWVNEPKGDPNAFRLGGLIFDLAFASLALAAAAFASEWFIRSQGRARAAQSPASAFDPAMRTALVEKIHMVSPPGSRQPYPLVTLDEFFGGNHSPGSICCNIANAPPPREIHERLKRLLEKPEIHTAWVDVREIDEGDWPFSDVVYLVTNAPLAQVSQWVGEVAKGFEPDEIGEGWYLSAPLNAPEPPPGFRYVHLWWD